MRDLKLWQRKMLRRPGYFNRLSKAMQDKMNSWIPEKVHKAITVTIKQMIRGVLFGARWTTGSKETEAWKKRSGSGRKNKILSKDRSCGRSRNRCRRHTPGTGGLSAADRH